METDAFDAERVTNYWSAEADESLLVAEHLIETGDYSYALFFGHLAIEKALKAVYAAKLREHAPPIHNLLRLAKAAGIEPSEGQTETLITITAFNIEARYPDFKRSFREKCTAEYTASQMASLKELFTWLRSRLS